MWGGQSSSGWLLLHNTFGVNYIHFLELKILLKVLLHNTIGVNYIHFLVVMLRLILELQGMRRNR